MGRGKKRKKGRKKPVDVTPEEIARACRIIRKGWSIEERRQRAGMKPVGSVEITRVKDPGLPN